MKRLLFYVALNSILTACAGNHDQAAAPLFPFQTQDSIFSELEKANFSCREEGCKGLESIGMIFTNLSSASDSISVAQCTGFLISPNIVATNAHCINQNLRENPSASCSDQLAIRFLSSPKDKNNIFQCKKIISSSIKAEILGQDYAFFEIDKSTARQPVEISKEGLVNQEKITSFVVTPLTQTSGGVLERLDCVTTMFSLLNFNSISRLSLSGLATGCRAAGGNSGSPVFNSKGQVIGLLQSEFNESYKEVLRQTFRTQNVNFPEELPPHFQFTNLACVVDPVSQFAEIEKCKTTKSLKMNQCLKLTNPRLDKEMKNVYKNWQESLPKVFKYKFFFNSKNLTYTANVDCVLTYKQNSDVYSQYVAKEGIIGLRKEVIKLQIPSQLEIASLVKFNSLYSFDDNSINIVEKNRSSEILEMTKENDQWSGVLLAKPQSSLGGISPILDRLIQDLEKLKTPVYAISCSDDRLEQKDQIMIVMPDGQIISEEEAQKIQSGSQVNCDNPQ